MRVISIVCAAVFIVLVSTPPASAQVAQPYDLQRSTISPVDFYTTNYGIFGQNTSATKGGLHFPRGSTNQYVFGAGNWFGCKKKRIIFNLMTGKNDTTLSEMCVVSYNPSSGGSWCVAGDRRDADSLMIGLSDKYKVGLSSTYNGDGTPKNGTYNWSIRNTLRKQLGTDGYFGTYVYDQSQRNTSVSDPVVVSDEDFTCVFKDSDLRNYEISSAVAKAAGYPLGLQTDQRIYSWINGAHKNSVVVLYVMTNTSKDTLMNCFVGHVVDPDIGTDDPRSATNDRLKYYSNDSSLNLAVAWTDMSTLESGKGFGYLGVALLETPTVSSDGYLVRNPERHPLSQQIGLKSFRNWHIANDPPSDVARYNFMSLETISGETGPTDKLFLMSTGPFNLRPSESFRLAVAYILAPTGKGGEADGTDADLVMLASQTKAVQDFYYGGMKTTDVELGASDPNATFKLSPNPADRNLTVNLRSAIDDQTQVTIYDRIGRVVKSAVFLDSKTSDQSLSLDVGDLSQGVYSISIPTKSGLEYATFVVAR